MRFTAALSLAVIGAFALVPARAHSPHDVISELAISPAFVVDRTLFAAITLTDTNLFALSDDAGRSWTYVGTPMVSSIPRAFAFSPDFLLDRTAFAASPSNGVWRTTNGGLNWTSCSVGLPAVTRDIAISPYFATDRTLLVATDIGVFVSTNGGDSWTPSNTGLADVHVLRVALAPDGQGGLLGFAAGIVMHVSANGGATWTVTGTFPKKVESIAISPNFATDLRLAVSFGRFGQGVAFSENAGQSFQFINQGLSDLSVEEVAIANDGTMFAATDTAGCFRAEAPGQPWVLKTKGFEALSDLTFVHNTEVVPSPDFANDHTVFEGAFEGLYRSYNRGDDWWQLNVYTQLLQRRFVFAPQFATQRELLAGDYGGAVFHYKEQPPLPGTPGFGGPVPGVSPSGGSTSALHPGSAPAGTQPGPPVKPFEWQALGTNLSSPWASVLAASPGTIGSRTLLYGYVGLFQSSNEGSTWVSANKPAPISVVRGIGFSPNYANDQTVFIGSGMEGSYRTTNGCQKWVELDGLPPFLLTSAICVSPGWTQDRTVYFASRNVGIWRSTDGGWQWTQVQNGLDTTNIKSLVMSPNFVVDRTLIAGSHADGVWVSYDGGDSWTQSNRGLPNTFSHRVESLAISPDFANDGTVFVALLNEGIFRSKDGAANWHATGPSLPAPPVMIELSPTYAQDQTLVVGTYGGTVISRNRGNSFEPLPGYIRADDDHPAVQYSPAWVTVGAGTSFCSTVTSTGNVGEWSSLEFYGRNISWYCDQKPDGSLVKISVDGGAPTVIDTSSHIPHAQQALFTQDFGTPGWHVVRIEHAGGTAGLRVLRSDGFAYEW